MKPFQSPAMLDQVRRHPFQQVGMRWTISLDTKVIDRPHDAAAHVMVPDTVDDHTCRKSSGTLVGIGDPVRQATAAVRGA